MGENWRPISGFPNYMISSEGEVWSNVRKKVLRPFFDDRQRYGRYARVVLCKDGYTHKRSVHRLVAYEFIGEPPHEGLVVAHKNGDPEDNRPENLYWASVQENVDDRSIHGRTFQGGRHHLAQLVKADIPRIRERIEEGESNKSIAQDYGVTPGTIWHIRRGITWKAA